MVQVSLMAGKEGLNLQFCNRIVLMDPHFNPMVEEQASTPPLPPPYTLNPIHDPL
jgi:hypothetical protein